MYKEKVYNCKTASMPSHQNLSVCNHKYGTRGLFGQRATSLILLNHCEFAFKYHTLMIRVICSFMYLFLFDLSVRLFSWQLPISVLSWIRFKVWWTRWATGYKQHKNDKEWKELTTWLSSYAVLNAVLVVYVPFPFGVWDRMWNSVVSIPFYLLSMNAWIAWRQ